MKQQGIALLTTTSPRAQFWSFLLSVGTVGALAAFETISGGSRVNSLCPNETVVFLDGGWRVLCGQVPHNDFYCPLGALVPYLTALGLRISFSPDAVTYAGLIVYAIAALILYVIGKDRLPAFWLAGLAVYFGVFLLSPRILGSPPSLIGPALAYNRWGEVIVGVLCLLLLPPFRVQRPLERWGEWALAGCLIGLCAFAKINYFSVALAALILILILRRPGHPALGAVLGMGMILFLFLIAFGIELPRLATDMRTTVQAQNPDQRRYELAVKFLGMKQYEGIVPSALGTLGLLLVLGRAPAPRSAKLEAGAISVFLLLAGWGLYAVNAIGQDGNLMVSSLGPIYLLEVSRRALKPSPEESGETDFQPNKRYLYGCLIATVLPLAILIQDGCGFVYAANLALGTASTGADRIDSGMLRSLLCPCPPASAYPDYINQGLSLLRRNDHRRGKIFAFDFSNPFSIALEVPPPRGDSLWWHHNRNFSERSHPPAEEVFGDVEIVLVPKRDEAFNWEATRILQKVYGPYLSSHFAFKDENDRWALWRKKGANAPSHTPPQPVQLGPGPSRVDLRQPIGAARDRWSRQKQLESRQHILNPLPDPQGHKSLRHRFSTNSLPPLTIR